MRPQGRGRILLISYHFGPRCATGGFRWTAMVDDLVAMGWTFDVITAARDDYRPPHRARTGPARHDVEVFTVPGVEWLELVVGGAARRLRRVTGRGAAARSDGAQPPQPRLEDVSVWSRDEHAPLRSRIARFVHGMAEELSAWIWARRAARLGRRLARHREYAAVVVSTPPNLHHLAGVALSRRPGIPYIADYRDPWLAGLGPLEAYYTPAYRAAGRLWERRSQRRARLVIHNTPRAMREVAATYPDPVDRTAIPNGYEPAAPPAQPDSHTFIVALTGWVHPFMDLRVLFRACSRFLTRTPAAGDHFRLHLMGTPQTFGGVSIHDIAAAAGVAGLLVWEDRASRTDALELQQSAALLVAFDWLHSAAVVMKFYDYVQMHGSLLLIGSPVGALAEAAGQLCLPVIDPHDDAGIDRVLDAAYHRWLQRDYAHPNDADGIFQRQHRSRELDATLRRVVGGPPAPASRASLAPRHPVGRSG